LTTFPQNFNESPLRLINILILHSQFILMIKYLLFIMILKLLLLLLKTKFLLFILLPKLMNHDCYLSFDFPFNFNFITRFGFNFMADMEQS